MNNIANIIYDYSQKNKLFDEKVIKELLDIILKENDLYDSINYAITNKNENNPSKMKESILGEYDFNKTIYIYLDEINRFINNKNDKYNFHYIIKPNSQEEYLYNNLLFLKTILHETYHAKQIAMVKDIDDNSIEKQIVAYEYKYVKISQDDLKLNVIKRYFELSKRKRTFQYCYDISFMERLANYYSFNKIKKLAIELDNLKIYNIFYYILNTYLLRKYYNNLEGPTFLLMKKLGYIDEIKTTNFYPDIANMDLDERIQYGFPITKDEHVRKKAMYK